MSNAHLDRHANPTMKLVFIRVSSFLETDEDCLGKIMQRRICPFHPYIIVLLKPTHHGS